MIDSVFKLTADKAGRNKMRAALLANSVVGVQRIGRSIMGEDIELYRIGEGKKRIVYFGAHHALESITCNLLFAFMHNLAQKTVNTCGKSLDILLASYTYMAVPCINPDGIEMRFHGVGTSPIADRQNSMSGGDYSTWQANARGVDLNHNYNSCFYDYKLIEREKDISAGPTLYSGEYPESEPESRTAANLVRALNPIGIISLHSQGEEIYLSPKTKSSLRIAERLSLLTGYTRSEPSGTARYGGLCDFTGDVGIPSFTLEVGRGKNPLDESCCDAIYQRIESALLLFPTML